MRRKRISLRLAIVLASIMVSLVPFAISMAALGYSAYKSYQDMTYTYAHYTTGVLTSNVQQIVSGAYDASLYPLANPQIKRYLSEDRGEISESAFKRMEENVLDAIFSLPYASEYIRYYIVQRMDGGVISTGPGYYVVTSSEMERALSMNGRAVWDIEKHYWPAQVQAKPSSYAVIYRLMRDPQRVSNHLGFMKLYISCDTLQEILEPPDNFPLMQNYVADAQGKVIISAGGGQPDIQAFPADQLAVSNSINRTVTLNGERFLIYTGDLRHCDWRVVMLMPFSYIRQYFQKLCVVALLAFCLFLIVSIALSALFSHIILRPIRSIGQLMISVGEEDYAARTDISGLRELAQLQESFNQMTLRLEKLHNESYVYNIKLRDAQIKELQTRINPHFLYNTLNSIYWMSTLNHLDDLSLMVSSLSNLLRISLSVESDGLISFRTECAHVHHYITIQQIRFRDSIVFDIVHEAGLDNCRVFPLVLQPLIENAISHGLEPNDGGTIRVRTRRDGKMLIYTVEDDGVGMDVERFNAIIHADDSSNGGKGMALKNIYDRIRLKYGSPYGLSFEPAPGGGSIFSVTQPLQEEQSDD